MKKFLILSLLFHLGISQAQPNNHLEMLNSITPTFPDCKDFNNKLNCYNDTFGNIIVNQLNTDFSNQNIQDTTFKVKIFAMTNADGTTNVKSIETDQNQYIPTIQKACNNIPLVTPVYNEFTKKHETSSTKFSLTFYVKNNVFGVVPSQTNKELANKKIDIPTIIQFPTVKDCITKTKEEFQECISNQIHTTLKNNTTKKVFDTIEKQNFKVEVNVDDKGKFKITVETQNPEIQQIITNTLYKLPITGPAFNTKGPTGIISKYTFIANK